MKLSNTKTKDITFSLILKISNSEILQEIERLKINLIKFRILKCFLKFNFYFKSHKLKSIRQRLRKLQSLLNNKNF
uniref:Ribosomal protein L29 n=1 Tax=Nitzschia alba TaxID=2858 RepID=A0A5C0F4Y4_NITAL|nr:ribosomal protein L29 [Nitzschia alba]QEI59620.1 ribosomal protein L29 [Nitzschia alba]